MFFFKYIFVFILLTSVKVTAQVDFATKQVIEDVILYQDSKTKSVFYYAPYGLQLVKNEKGKPDFKFVQMRYTGTRLTQDQGSYGFMSILRFKVANHVPSKIKRERIKQVIRNNGIPVTKLQPLPIHNLRATLIHAADSKAEVKTYTNGFFEGDEKASANTYWTERDFTLRLSNEDAQLFWNTFHGQKPTISVEYTYAAKGLNSMEKELTVSGPEKFTEDMKARFGQEKDSINQTLNEKIIVSGAESITIDPEKWPDLMKQIDINERIPPEYAALDIYCYDFNNEIRKELYAKRIEIKAESMGNREVTSKTIFRAEEPDIYAQTVKFIYAVKLDKPYSYRIMEIFKDGRLERSQWRTVKNWHQILDVTSQLESNLN